MPPVSMKLRKYTTDARYVALWYDALPTNIFTPPGICLADHNVLEMDFINGYHPRDVHPIQTIMHAHIWNKGDLRTQDIDRKAYVEYVIGNLVNYFDAPNDEHKKTVSLIREIRDEGWHKLTPVKHCHGDLTLCNVIIRHIDHSVFLLDPGYTRGLPCRELDEAKLLQSLDGFDEVHMKLPPIHYLQRHMFKTRRIHWLLLLTHYVRMLKHMRDSFTHAWAVQRIRQLTEMMTNG